MVNLVKNHTKTSKKILISVFFNFFTILSHENLYENIP